MAALGIEVGWNSRETVFNDADVDEETTAFKTVVDGKT